MSYHAIPPQHVVSWTADDEARWQSRKRLEAILADPCQTAAFFARLGLLSRPVSPPGTGCEESSLTAGRGVTPGPA